MGDVDGQSDQHDGEKHMQEFPPHMQNEMSQNMPPMGGPPEGGMGGLDSPNFGGPAPGQSGFSGPPGGAPDQPSFGGQRGSDGPSSGEGQEGMITRQVQNAFMKLMLN